ncbi:MAG: hypothetical protein EBU08_17605, partial [Micrococcales bacterium]|nr:hypothetical protein [Micrococcales bacterium]
VTDPSEAPLPVRKLIYALRDAVVSIFYQGRTCSGFFATKVAGETVAQVCTRCQAAGVTWEGVWDGQSCFSNGSNIPADAGGSTCTT